MKFTPLKFQATLASAGVALMPNYFLKFNIFKTGEHASLSMLSSLSDTPLIYVTALSLTTLMGIFILIHFTLTAIFLKELSIWLLKPNDFKRLIKNPLTAPTVFSPLISLPMSLIVLMGPTSFFIPQLMANMQSLILPAFSLFCFFWLVLISLELKVAKVFFTESVEPENLNFGWLLDVLAFGAVSLLGSVIANYANSDFIASTAAFMVLVTVLVGMALFMVKLTILVYQRIKSKETPEIGVLPGYYLAIPPACLLGFGFYQLIGYAGKTFGIDVSAVLFVIINFSYFFAISWFIFAIFLLKEYIEKDFLSSKFSPAQWGMV